MSALFPVEEKAEVAVPAAGDLLFRLFVPGTPQPAGSKRAIPVFNKHTGRFVTAANGRPVISVVDDAKGSRAWKERITALAMTAWSGRALLDEPLYAKFTFTFDRPQSHFGTGKNAHVLKARAPFWHATKPDAVKCQRAAEDALNGVVWRDDSRIAKHGATKRYGDRPGVLIEVFSLSEIDA